MYLFEVVEVVVVEALPNVEVVVDVVEHSQVRSFLQDADVTATATTANNIIFFIFVRLF